MTAILKHLLVLLLFMASGARAADISASQNLRYCEAGYTMCDQGRLTTVEVEQVRAAALVRNYRHCESGYLTCDASLLTDAQREQVRKAGLARNFRNCDNGYSACDVALLTEGQRTQVEQSHRRRNFGHCLSGYATCDNMLLSEQQRAEVGKVALKRNVGHCINGYAACDQSVLTIEQAKSVEASARARNLHYRKSGFTSCDLAKLSEDERQALSAGRLPNVQRSVTTIAKSTNEAALVHQQSSGRSGSDTPAQANISSAEVATPALSTVPPLSGLGCAENGSCYGDISASTGRAKTMRVNSYYRKDGTYVRGHYRSR